MGGISDDRLGNRMLRTLFDGCRHRHDSAGTEAVERHDVYDFRRAAGQGA